MFNANNSNNSARQIFGIIAVNMFAFISGYYIFHSIKRSTSWFDFFCKRFFRLFPQLFVCIILTFLVFYSVSGEFFFSFLKYRETLFYLMNIFFIGRYTIPIVFSDNPYPNVANGSLWVLRYLILMYIISWVIYRIKIKNIVIIIFILFSFIFYLFLSKKFSISFVFNISRIGFYYLVGFAISMKKVSFLKVKTFLLFISSSLLVFINHMSVSITLLSIYLIFLFNEILEYSGSDINIVDISYGIFIYAFPIQQMLIKYISFKKVHNFFFISSIVSVFVAYMSYNLIEKNIKKLRGKKVVKS
jgi:peptidoglycan/LPS O-acetylase OafA/YrhL